MIKKAMIVASVTQTLGHNLSGKVSNSSDIALHDERHVKDVIESKAINIFFFINKVI